MTDDQFVTRALYAAMVAERDDFERCLKAEIGFGNDCRAERDALDGQYRAMKADLDDALQREERLTEERDALAARVDQLHRSYLSVHVERDALAERVRELEKDREFYRLAEARHITERDALAERYNLCRQEIIGNDIRRFAAEDEAKRLTAQLAAAHGLLARAERAEAALAEARQDIAAVLPVIRRHFDFVKAPPGISAEQAAAVLETTAYKTAAARVDRLTALAAVPACEHHWIGSPYDGARLHCKRCGIMEASRNVE